MRKIVPIFWCFFLGITLCCSQNTIKADSLKKALQKATHDSVKLEVLYQLSNIFLSSDMEQANQYNKQSFALSKGKYRDFGLAKSYNIKGIVFDIKGEIDSAYQSYEKALYHAEKAQLLSTQASALNNIGLLEWNKAKYVNAISYYTKALRVFEKNNDKKGQANALSNIGMVYQSFSDFKNAKAYHLKGLAIRQAIGDDYGVSVSYVNLGRFHESKKEEGQAISYYEKAIEVKKKINDQLGIAITHNNLASILARQQRFPEAMRYLNEAESIAKRIGAKAILKNTYQVMTAVHVSENEINQAKKTNELGRLYSEELQSHSGMLNYYRNEEKMALLEKNFKRAYDFAQKSDSLDDTLHELDIQKAIAEIESKYEIEKKEKELTLEKFKVSEREQKIKQKNTLLMVVSFVFITALLIGYLVYNQQRLKNRQLKKENQLREAMTKIETQNHLQQQRLDISRDLHDNIGAQLTFIISSLDNLKFLELPKESLNQKINTISDFTTATIYELRDTIWAMNKNDITFDDFKTRLANFIDSAKSTHQKVNFDFLLNDSGKDLTFSSVDGMNLYRIIQEAVNNALKHAFADSIQVCVAQKSALLEVSISDDGVGFEMEKTETGNGLNNMQKRAKELSATLSIASGLGNGTKVVVEKPIG